MGILFLDIKLNKVDADVKITNYMPITGANKESVRDEILANCEPIRGYSAQEPMIIPRLDLPGKFYIETRGPFRSIDPVRDKELLSIWYLRCLELAYDNHCKTVQIPLISSDTYPDDTATQIAYETCNLFLKQKQAEMGIHIIVNGCATNTDEADEQDKKSIFRKRSTLIWLSIYVKEHYCYEPDKNEPSEADLPEDDKVVSVSEPISLPQEPKEEVYFQVKQTTDIENEEDDNSLIYEKSDLNSPWLSFDQAAGPEAKVKPEDKKEPHVTVFYQMGPAIPDKDDFIVDETFREMLLRLMNERDMSAPEVYTQACMDRKLFSKILSSDDYQPRKYTVVRLALALDLSLDETNEFMNNAGFALSHGKLKDLVIEYCIKHHMKSVNSVNEILEEWGLTSI